jgi:peptide/nickel transport system substrate-binding protein
MSDPGLTRRDVLKAGVTLAAAAHLGVGTTGSARTASAQTASAQTPRRGGVFRISLGDPSHFDPHLTVGWSTHIALSFTHSRLLKHKAGPAVTPGTFPIEGDLAESWAQTSDTTYVFKLRRGVRWHAKPPVGGRELTADDVKYSFDRFLGPTNNPNRTVLEEIDKVEALDRYTVRFTLKAPFAWFLDAVASTVAWIVPREAAEQHGDLKRPEACIGTGPWMLERYEPNVRLVWVRHPDYFVPNLPYADGVEAVMETDASSRLARWLTGQFDFSPNLGMVVRRLDLDIIRNKKPGLQSAEFPWMIGSFAAMKLDQEPFRDVRARRALAMASNLKEILDTNPIALGHGKPNPAVPAALVEWSIPIDQLTPLGRRHYEHDPKAAARLLAEAGYPNGVKVPFETGSFGSDWMDGVQTYMRDWKGGGIDTELKLKESGAFLSSAMLGRFDRLMLGMRGGVLFPDPYLASFHLPGVRTNSSGVNDPKLTDMIKLQRGTLDANRRRDIVWDIQRYLAEQMYYFYGPSARVVAAWEPYVRNFAPNLGNDYGGRLMAAWLNR